MSAFKHASSRYGGEINGLCRAHLEWAAEQKIAMAAFVMRLPQDVEKMVDKYLGFPRARGDHGAPRDRGNADASYGRRCRPHYYVGMTYRSQRVEQGEMTADEINEYVREYQCEEWKQMVRRREEQLRADLARSNSRRAGIVER